MKLTTNEVEYRDLHDFRLAIRSFLAFSEKAAREHGIDPQQHQLLLSIRACGGEAGMTIGEAAESLLLRHHSAVELVGRAIRNELITRSKDATDGRLVRLNLSSRGEEVLRQLSEHHIRELRAAGPALVQALDAIVGHNQ